MHVMLLPFLVAAVACPQVPPRVEPRADRPRYVVEVDAARPFRAVSGELRAVFTPNRPIERLVFRTWAGSNVSVEHVTSTGVQLRVSRPNPTTLSVPLERTVAAGSSVTVSLSWTFVLPETHFDRNARFGDGVRLGTFLPLLAWDPRRGWITEPRSSSLAESAATPASDFDLRVRAPDDLRVVATGVEVATQHFQARAVRDIALAVGPFQLASTVERGVKLQIASVGAPGNIRLDLVRRAMRNLVARYGAYPWKTYTVVVPPDLARVGIEYPMLTYIGRSKLPKLFVDHETAHQWFYALVGNDQWRDPWLDETLATWAQTRVGSREPPTRRVPPGARRHVGSPMSYWDRQGNSYFYGVYGEGVRALRSLGNDNAVDCALRRYVARRAYTLAQPGDLLAELNRVIPGAERRLRAWGIHR
jgi:hypothetical protein